MTCSKCKKSAIPDVQYAGKSYCKIHFLELMEKRIRKNLRTRQLLNTDKEYTLYDDGSSEAKLTEYFINKIFKGHLKLKIIKKNPAEQNSADFHFVKESKNQILPSNLDEQALIFLEDFLKNKKNTKEKTTKEIIPLEVLMQKEVELVCSFLNIPFKQRVKKDILIELEKKYPGTKFSVFQSKMNLARKN